MNLDEFYLYKDRLVKDILTTDSIVELINENVPVEDAKSLLYKQVFPYEYVPETVEEGLTFICIDVDVAKSLSSMILQPAIYVYIFAHKSNLRAPGGGVRIDKICSEISKKLNGSRVYGMGELDLYSVKRFVPLTDYYGKVMLFNAEEWNRTNPNKHPIPSNRKNGK